METARPVNVFVSQPAWVATEFEVGLNRFLGFLPSIGLDARTIGRTDYPTRPPLDEVIRLMRECSGAIILGYPQIEVTTGAVKGKPLSDTLLLPSEWNHIEAGLAYASGLPLLVIHHTGVRGGLFDRGATAHFLYEENLSDPGWCLSSAVRGALTRWREEVLTHTQCTSLPVRDAGSQEDDSALVTDEHVGVLQLLCGSGNRELTVEQVAASLHQHQERARYLLETLDEHHFVISLLIVGAPTRYVLAKKGRELLVGKGLL